MTKIIDIERLAPWVQQFATASPDLIIKNANNFVNSFLELDRRINNQCLWKFYDHANFTTRINGYIKKFNKDVKKFNKFYWCDMAELIQAYSLMSYYRANEIMRTATVSLNTEKILPASILSRSLLEIASVLIENSNFYYKIINDISVSNSVITSHDLEKRLVRNLWGTRLGNDIPEYLIQKNILTILQRISKNPQAKDLLPTYEYLCELAHPNQAGYFRFVTDSLIQDDDGSFLIEIDKYGKSMRNDEAFSKIIWALAWSAEVIKNGFFILLETLELLKSKFEIKLNGDVFK